MEIVIMATLAFLFFVIIGFCGILAAGVWSIWRVMTHLF